MKQHLGSSVVVPVVVAAALVAFGRQSESRQSRRELVVAYFKAQPKAIEVIQEQAGKLEMAIREYGRSSKIAGPRQNLSEEERDNLRRESGNTLAKRREVFFEALEVIEQQILKLTYPQRHREKHEESIAELRAIHALATEEKAEKTTKHLEELIAKRNKEFADTLQRIGLPAEAGRGRR